MKNLNRHSPDDSETSVESGDFFHKTALNEFYRVRKKVYRSTDELQADLDAWIKEYNHASQHPSVNVIEEKRLC